MLRLVRSALRTADRIVQAPSSTARLKPLGNFLASLKGPSIQSSSAHTSASVSNSFLGHAAHRIPPINASFSLPTRVALSRTPLSAPHLPRVPMIPRTVSQVGLGTARNFSSSRHVFQNLVDNVPMTTRALWEADWDFKMREKENRKTLKREKQAKEAASKIADKSKPIRATQTLATPTISICTTEDEKDLMATSTAAEFSEYFAPAVSFEHIDGVTTFLVVPLHPPTNRTPLPHSQLSHPDRLLPLPEIQDMHGTFSTHQARVSSLFSRLDTADVWSKGVQCTQCGYGSMLTNLQLSFQGWTKEMVLSVIGEGGRGWCEITEEWDRIPETTSLEFVVPTLDFSASFASVADPLSGQDAIHNDWTLSNTRPSSPLSDDSDGWSSSDGEYHIPPASVIVNQPTGMALGFSFDFLSRGSPSVNDVFEPF